MAVLRPRLDVVMLLDGAVHEFSTNLRDMLNLKAQTKGQLSGDAEDGARLAHLAAVRLGLFDGSFDEFADTVEVEIETEPPPLTRPATSPGSSPQ